MSKQQINFRASDLTARQLADLREWWGVNQGEAVTIAVDRAYREAQKGRQEMESGTINLWDEGGHVVLYTVTVNGRANTVKRLVNSQEYTQWIADKRDFPEMTASEFIRIHGEPETPYPD